jgi:ParB family chromosome partitioning protein
VFPLRGLTIVFDSNANHITTWTNTQGATYFAKISKPGTIEALREDRNGAIAPAWEKAKNFGLAVIAEREIAGTGWLPEPLRSAGKNDGK